MFMRDLIGILLQFIVGSFREFWLGIHLSFSIVIEASNFTPCNNLLFSEDHHQDIEVDNNSRAPSSFKMINCLE